MKIKRPMLLAATLCITCVIAVFYCKSAIFAAIFFAATALFVNIFKLKNAKITVVILMFVTVIFSTSFSLLKIGMAETLYGKTVKESFVIINSPYYSNDVFSAEAVCLSDNVLKKADKISLRYDNADLEVGDVFVAEVKLKTVSDDTYKSNYYSKGIYIGGYIKDFEMRSDDSSFLCLLPKLRKNIKEILISSPISYEAKSVAAAITIGDRNDFVLAFEDEIKAAGVSHVFVVSGMHLVVIVGTFLKLLTRLTYNKYCYAFLSFFCVMMFCLICGFTTSVLRAAVMYLLLAAAPLFGRDNDPLNSLGGTVCILSAISPYTILSIGFQLSATATLGILLLSEFISQKLCQAFNIKGGLLSGLAEMTAVTVSASVMTAPIAIYHFGVLSTVALATNLLIAYTITYSLLINAIGIMTGLVLGSGYLSSAILYVGSLLSEYSVYVIKYFSALPFSTAELPRCSAAIFVLLAVLLVVYKCLSEKEIRILRRRVD